MILAPELPLFWPLVSAPLGLTRTLSALHERKRRFQPGRSGLDSVAAEALVQRPVLKGERLLPLAKLSDVDLLGDAQRIVEFNTKVSDRAVHLGVAKQELHRPQVAGLSVNQGSLCSPQRVRPVPARIEADRGHPVADETGVLPCRQVRRGVQPAWKEEPAARHGGRGDPLENGLSGVLGHFELDGSSGLALDDRYAVADGAAHHEVTDFEADEVTAAQLDSIARLKRAKSRRSPAISSRARMAQTCLGRSGRF